VPYLKKLEKELKNKDVVFVSVSSDTNEQAWKSKMKELDMHGHQYLDKGNTLCDALNVKGIPFFVIYDKAGNLYTYGAMRPSSGARLRDFLESLH
jgi:alkyl hydroperoxide reductase subunit AhpC